MKIKSLLLGLCAAVMLPACNSTDEPTDDGYYLDIVTLESNGKAGAIMTFQEMGDSPLITLSTTQQFMPEIFKTGSRIAIVYKPTDGSQYVSGPVTVAQAMETLGAGTAPKEGTSTSTGKWASADITLYRLWRTGNYLNFTFQGLSNGEPKQCDLYVDKNTLDSDFPELHLIFEGSTGNNAENYTFYASYSIEDIWKRPNVKGVRVYYADMHTPGGNMTSITKDKFQLTPEI